MPPSKNNIYLNPSVEAYATKNPSLSLDGLASTGETFLINILFVLFFIAILVASVFYLGNAANIGSKSQSKDQINRIAFGFMALVIVTSVFSLVLKNGSLSLSPLSSKNIQPSVIQNDIVREPDAGNGATIGKDETQMLELMKSSEQEKRGVLSYQKIQINSAACTSIGQKNCTSVGGMSEETLAMLSLLKKNCSCTLTVTGGTEWWSHSKTTNHRPGNRTAVDLRNESILNTFIGNSSAGFTPLQNWNTCFASYSWNGFRFCDEKPQGGSTRHWHIQPL